MNERRDELCGRARVVWLVQYGIPLFCALMLALAAFGAFVLKEGQDEITRLVTETPRASRTFEISYTDKDGQTIRVAVQSEQGESSMNLALRFKRELEIMQEQHPRR